MNFNCFVLWQFGSIFTTGSPRHVELSFVSVSTIRAFPDELAVVLYNLNLAVKAADLTIIRLRVELGVHYVVVYELNDLEDGFYVVGEIRDFNIGNRSAR